MANAIQWYNDSNAVVKRVYYEGTSTVYEGMPVCYNYDSTDNWTGWGSATAAASKTEQGTTAEGEQNEGKYIRVEDPANNNIMHFAGVVAGTEKSGQSGPCELDIYIPNGAVVPVRCDVDTTAGITILAITVGSQELGQPVSGTSRPVAIAMETETGLDSTTDVTLAKLAPNMFSYQNLDGTHLEVGAGTSNLALNEIRVQSAQTSGTFCALYVRAKVTAGGTANSTSGGGLAAYFRAESAATLASSLNAVHIQLVLSGGTYTSGVTAGLHVKVAESGCTLSGCGKLVVLTLESMITNTTASNQHGWMYLENNGAQAPDFLFIAGSSTDFPMVSCTDTPTKGIPIMYGGTKNYIAVCEATS